MAHLARDPELRYTQKGTAVCNLRLASNHVSKNNEEKLFITAIVWSKRAENCNKYLKKGSGVFIEGRLMTRSWEDSQNQKRSATEIQVENIQFMDRIKEGTSAEENED